MKEIRIIPSKSDAHRALICAALSDTPCRVEIGEGSKDILATRACLSAMGGVARDQDNPGRRDRTCLLPCGESGSTLRFLLPVAGALDLDALFAAEGRLGQRPLSPLREELEAHGCMVSPQGQVPVTISGQLRGGSFQLPGNVSSQYVSGLLFALPLLAEDSQIRVTAPVASAGYLDLTLAVIRRFGIEIGLTEDEAGRTYRIPGGQTYHGPADYQVEGDWSNAAFFLAAGVLGREPVRVRGLRNDSVQGDRKIGDLLRAFGARVDTEEDGLTAWPGAGRLRGITVDADGIPDMVPALALVASQAEGETRIENAGRLRLKESDRLTSVASVLNGLGARVEELQDGLIIHGSGLLEGGTADGANDHRIVMMAAVASLASRSPVIIHGSQAVQKSYPAFFRRLAELGLDGNLRAE